MNFIPADMIEQIAKLDWFAIPFASIFLLPVLYLSVRKTFEEGGVTIDRKRLFKVVVVVYVITVGFLKWGLIQEDNFRLFANSVRNHFYSQGVVLSSFDDLKAFVDSTKSDEDFRELALRLSSEYATTLGNKSKPALRYIDKQAESAIFESLKPLAIASIKGYMLGTGEKHILFSTLADRDGRFTFVFCEWLAKSSDLHTYGLKFTSKGTGPGSYAFE